MNTKNDVEVIINGKQYTISGYESSDYLQRIATHINDKYAEFKQDEGYNRLDADMKNILLAINLSDDYYKVQESIQDLQREKEDLEKEIFNMKHDMIAMKSRLEDQEKKLGELRKDKRHSEHEVIRLETELKNAKEDNEALISIQAMAGNGAVDNSSASADAEKKDEGEAENVLSDDNSGNGEEKSLPSDSSKEEETVIIPSSADNDKAVSAQPSGESNDKADNAQPSDESNDKADNAQLSDSNEKVETAVSLVSGNKTGIVRASVRSDKVETAVSPVSGNKTGIAQASAKTDKEESVQAEDGGVQEENVSPEGAAEEGNPSAVKDNESENDIETTKEDEVSDNNSVPVNFNAANYNTKKSSKKSRKKRRR